MRVCPFGMCVCVCICVCACVCVCACAGLLCMWVRFGVRFLCCGFLLGVFLCVLLRAPPCVCVLLCSMSCLAVCVRLCDVALCGCVHVCGALCVCLMLCLAVCVLLP